MGTEEAVDAPTNPPPDPPPDIGGYPGGPVHQPPFGGGMTANTQRRPVSLPSS
jgi:hypothetical protein